MGKNLILLAMCFIVVTQSYAAIFGGVKSGDVESLDGDTVNAVISSLVYEDDLKSNNLYYTRPVKIENVKTQVVAGEKYIVTFIRANSDCTVHKKLQLEDVQNSCRVTEHSEMSRCVATFTMMLWLNPNQPQPGQTLQCSVIDTVTKRSVGGENEQHKCGNMTEFMSFMVKHNKIYQNGRQEAEYRCSVYEENLKKVKILNDLEQGDAKYGINHFGDLTEEEFRKYYLTPVWDISYNPGMLMADIPNANPPDSFDWREHNVVTEVKNQGMCGSCWAFSTTGNVEGQWAMKTKKLVDLSEQELVDCDTLDQGCNGGLPTNAYQSIMKLGGLETESEYPYEGKNDKCAFNRSEANVNINSYVNISSNEDDMKVWLFKNGPISVGINAFAMQFYFGGVSHPFSFLCNPNSLDHGVLIVGYGIKKGIFRDSPYWIIKNSWGGSWGEKGYYLLYRGSGVCGINKMPTSAVIN